MRKTRPLGEWSGRHGSWGKWFAWRPVRLGKHGKYIWLRVVKRRFITCYEADFGPCLRKTIRWEYRA